MGNWNGTVKCGYCGFRGHNRRSCKALTDRWERRYEQAIEDGDDQRREYAAIQLARRTGTNPDTGAKRARRTEMGRSCSYCKVRGHTRRTCPTLKADKQNYRRMTAVVRREMLGKMRQAGLGVGSLVTIVESRWDSDSNSYLDVTRAYMVTDLDWDQIHPHNQNGVDALKVADIKNPTASGLLALPTEVTGSHERWRNVPKLAAPVAADKISSPSAWLAGAGDWIDADEIGPFQKGEPRNITYWNWSDDAAALMEEAGISTTDPV